MTGSGAEPVGAGPDEEGTTAGTGGGEGSGADPGTTVGAPLPVGNYRVVVVASVTLDLPDQHPVVVLREAEGLRRQLSFAVGLQDGIALAQALRRTTTPRPLTHELLASVLHGFDVDVVAVRLVGRLGATYFAELDLRGPDRRSVLSCRPSDALALALRQSVTVPLLVDARLLEVATDVPPPGG